jgi:hypothetical protein
MTLQTARPQAPAPNLATIPAELTSRPQWVMWRYELKDGKWTKVPYGARKYKASTTRPTSWLSFNTAIERYRANLDYFDGIGYVFAKDDPYVGGDIDHSLATDRLPPTYAEISPSGNGIKFIARASGSYGRKTAHGELYSSLRFFTITGNVLPGHETIAECQAEIEAFAASLGPVDKRMTNGRAGSGSRAEQLASIPESEWEAARALNRTSRDSLLRRIKAAGGRDTQLALVLAGDYADFHRRWSFVGLFRADGTLDDSQVRAVAAHGIKGRAFTFPEYVVIMSALYAQQALKKWGTKERWREELAALWQKAPGPKFAPRLKKTPRVARGRASNHAQLVEQVYSLLIEHKAGTQAIVKTGAIAGVIGCARRTVVTILNELRDAKRITTQSLGQHGGLVITFSGVIIDGAPAAELPALARTNDDRPAYAEETTGLPVFLQDRARVDHTSQVPTLAELAKNYLDQPAEAIGERLISTKTGAISYRRTAKHFAQLVVAEYPYTAEQAIAAYKADQQRRKREEAEAWQRFFAELRAMSDAELIAYIGGGCRRGVAELARDGSTFDKHLYQTRLNCAKRQAARRKLAMPKRATKAQQRAEQDAAAVAAAFAAARQQRQQRPRLVACEPIHYAQPAPSNDMTPADYSALYARLRSASAAAATA